MHSSTVKRLVMAEQREGFIICECGKYAHVISSAVLAKFDREYRGEMCDECSCMMVAVDRINSNDDRTTK